MSQSVVTALKSLEDEPGNFKTSLVILFLVQSRWEEMGRFMIKIDLFCAKHIENFLQQLEHAKFFIGSVTFHLE